ncbi:hypothetical protein QEH42_gp280 [Microbacterium phage Pumpernickel]|uniref:Uncharacterized protein n=1 Tax=Microbacterium phage Pumpernickel TaxID=2885983 RepID=A0AAE8Y7M7_9CAUD|nr:hypothetical protein QEH42_gp280 [Microbacterium phage Pumpernickel]UDL15938.1 hypothetical protein SEA_PUMPERNICKEL_188 [Microbacterium phage Pumpernickel]
MTKLPRTGFDFVVTVVFIVAVVFAAISLVNYIVAAVLFFTHELLPRLTLFDIANISGLLAGGFAVSYVILALIQEWRIRRERRRGQ